MAERRPTIADVARRAGVSKGTVSFALNGRPGVAAATRERILEAAEALSWRPNHRARSLSVSRAFALGLVIARDPSLLGSDPFFPTFIAGVETVLAERGQALVLQVVGGGQAETEGYRRLAEDGRVDGVFLTDLRRNDPRIALVERLGLPAITLNRPDVPSPFPAVCLNDRPGITAAVDHLVGLGHARIAHVAGPDDFLHGRGRREAFLDALAAHGLPLGRVEVGDFTASGGTAATRRLLAAPDPPTAIVYANDLMAIAGINVAHGLGISVPARLSVAGYDDTELSAHLHPPLTTVRTDVFGWGQVAARSLLALINGESAGDVELEPARLVVRRSTAPPHDV
ncbi:LacI family DNA-binding transcriptional regulator [Actinomadura sp. HBU206391]|uniref:LacI family DNA-binding transcriptional regulator n=1 Tax=Actinomadura sp. HBU206391 TaxID=2731692 RepID=UPI0016503168|nr:LacI family DNA-binding transcriptional regulator [Actinomadura sp. HBU206391]MBC6460062.1 LacI family DNA-binding transcriptional regulator [Actinomadura sp. HBU206391]